MRKDIEIHINTGDITLPANNRTVLRQFQWVERPQGKEQRYLYGEVIIPSTLSENSIVSKGVYVTIPYTPINKEIRLRIKREYGNEFDTYIKNPIDGTEWFTVQTSLYGKGQRNVFAPELIAISEDRFYLMFDGGIIRLFSGNKSDLNIIKANTQNKNLLLACIPGNNYRYPLLGVGLVRWTNSSIDVSTLAVVLQKEFANDGTPVRSAEYNHELRHLNLILDTTTVDADGNI